MDDDTALCSTFAQALSRSGFAVEAFQSGDAALEVLRQRRNFDTLVTDLEMPGMNGIELLQAVRQLGANMPLIIVTGNPSAVSMMSMVELGGFRYLFKPVPLDELIGTVRSATALYRQ